MQIMGKFPVKEFFESGNKPVTQCEWVQYFKQVAMLAQGRADVYPQLTGLLKQCDKWLATHAKSTNEKFEPKKMDVDA